MILRDLFSESNTRAWKFKPCTLSAIDLSALLEKSYRSLHEQSGNPWFPHRCSYLAQYVAKAQRGALKESTNLDSLHDFQRRLKTFDCRGDIDLARGKSVAVIQAFPHIYDHIIEMRGFINPKKIKDVYRDDNDDIEWIEFEDGSTFPDRHFIDAGQGGGELEGTSTMFFSNKGIAEQTLSLIGTGRPDGWKISFANIREQRLNETVQASQVLAYTKSQHDGFNQDYAITNFPKWTKFQQPVSKLKIPDENGRGENPYGTNNPIDIDHAASISKDEILNNPIVVDRAGWIIDGNHRAYRAKQLKMKTIPAFIPVDQNSEPEPEYHRGRMVKTGLYY